MFTVRQVSRNDQLPFGTHVHLHQRFRPALDNAADRKLRGLAAFVGAVKFSAIGERAAIVNADGVGGAGNRAGAIRQHEILQAVRQNIHAGLVFIGRKISFAIRFIFGAQFRAFLRLLGGEFFFERFNRLLGLFRGEQRRAARQGVFDAAHINIRIETDLLLLPLMTGHHTNSVANASSFVGEEIGVLSEQRSCSAEANNREEQFFHGVSCQKVCMIFHIARQKANSFCGENSSGHAHFVFPGERFGVSSVKWCQ